MKFKTSLLVLILFALVMVTMTTAVANEEMASNLSANDAVSLSADSAFSVEDDQLGIESDMNEASFEDDDENIPSNVLKASSNSLLTSQVNGGTFNDIQKAINGAGSGETIFLNGYNYSGTKAITIDRDIVIHGGSSLNDNNVSVLDAKGASRIFYSSGKYNIVLRNLVFENAKFNGNGYFAYFAGGKITIENLTIHNQDITGNYFSNAIYIGANSNLNASNLIFTNNKISSSKGLTGILFNVGKSSKVTISNLNISGNNITTSNNIQGFVYVNQNSDVNVDGTNFRNNELISKNIYGSLFRVLANSNLLLLNLEVLNNALSSSENIGGGFINSNTNSNVSLINLTCDYNNLFSSNTINGGFYLSGGNSNVLLVNSSNHYNYFVSKVTLTVAGYLVNGPSNYTIKDFYFVGNYVESIEDMAISVGFNLNGFSSFNVRVLLESFLDSRQNSLRLKRLDNEVLHACLYRFDN